MNLQYQILAIACLVAITTALPGVFLVLRGVALMSDAISHAILLGIAIMFLLTHSLSSPLLILGASLAGFATVLLTEYIIQTNRVKKDAAIGLVFPFFFSLGIILISRYARHVHLDIDMVITGELAFAPFNRLAIAGMDCGPIAFWVLGVILLINGLFLSLFYKELTLATFDPITADLFGFRPTLLYYTLMGLTSITAVGAFESVGSIVVVALMITPPATAYLLSQRLNEMIVLSCGFGIIAAILGYTCASFFDVSIAGSIASMTGILFTLTLLFAPEKGILARTYKHQHKKVRLAQSIVCTYLEKAGGAMQKDTFQKIPIGWKPKLLQQVLQLTIKNNFVTLHGEIIALTQHGYREAHRKSF